MWYRDAFWFAMGFSTAAIIMIVAAVTLQVLLK